MKPSLGWDLAGYGDSGSALCRADRIGHTINATILRAPFICRPRHKIAGTILSTVIIEIEMLRRFAKFGSTYLDVPIDLQLLPSIMDHLQIGQVSHYWQLVKRPVDHIFDALEPLSSNLGYAVARIGHLLGQLITEDIGLALGENLFETYPAATLQLVWNTNQWTEAKYKGGEMVYQNGTWKGLGGKKKTDKARQIQQRKNDGLATLANRLCLQAPEGFTLNDDEFDAVLCAITGCIPECSIRRETLTATIRAKLVKIHGPSDWIDKMDAPKGYVVFDRLPPDVQVCLRRIDCLTPDALFTALCS